MDSAILLLFSSGDDEPRGPNLKPAEKTFCAADLDNGRRKG